MNKKVKKILAVLVNYGDEQLEYLKKVVSQLKGFNNYQVTVVVNSNIKLDIPEIDVVNVFTLDNYQLLPLTCRKTIWENKDNYDIFIYGENDHLFKEEHIDNFMYYTSILPKNRIAGLLQFEENKSGKYYPAYHGDFDWDYNTVEIYDNKVFAHFNNIHQATFIITKNQLIQASNYFDFNELVSKQGTFVGKLVKKLKVILKIQKNDIPKYSVKCQVNTDIYQFAGMKKLICISEFDKNLIHHLPNVYIEGDKGRYQFKTEASKMKNAIQELLTIAAAK